MRLSKDKQELQTPYVEGSGLVPIPVARANEIPKVIAEYHRRESDRAIMTAMYRRIAL